MDQIEALAKLLCSTSLRHQLAVAPSNTANDLCEDPQDVEFLLALDTQQLSRQGDLLLNKRAREVSFLIPHSVRVLQADFKDCFNQYAHQYWPGDSRRYQMDAFAFLCYLRDQGRRICLLEYRRLGSVLKKPQNFLDVGFVATKRGWRFGLVLKFQMSNRYREFVLTLG